MGTSTAPWTFEGKVQTFQNKTLRWKGHFEHWKTVIDMGLLDLETVNINGVGVSPRDVFHACVEPKIRAGKDDRDFVIVRIKALGEKSGKSAEALVEVIDYYDEATGFTAMERTTGWHGAIVAIMNAIGQTPPASNPSRRCSGTAVCRGDEEARPLDDRSGCFLLTAAGTVPHHKPGSPPPT